MEYGAIDLHKKDSQIRIVTESGQVIDQRVATTRERLTQVFWGRPRMRVLVESSTESEWVAQHLEQMGHEVVVADPNYAPMYGERSRRIKTDRRDVAALTEACQRGTYRPAHRRSARQQEVQCRLHVRQGLTQTRTRAISLARSITRAAGLRIAGGQSQTFLTRLQALEMSAAMTTTLTPLRGVIEILNDELGSADDQFKALVETDPVVKRLTTLPGIGPITASAFVATLDVTSRFERAGQVTSYLGLVPQEYSSGEKQRRGHLVRSAQPYLQSLLVQAAWGVWRASDPRTAQFREWAQGIARRRGKKVAVVALARRLARTLFAMWRDQTDYRPARVRPTRPARNEAATAARSSAVAR
jgi:transposase